MISDIPITLHVVVDQSDFVIRHESSCYMDKTCNFMTSVSILLLGEDIVRKLIRQTVLTQEKMELLLESPPGQINEVFNDLTGLTTVDKSLFKAHNLDQNIVFQVGDEKVVIGYDASFEGDALVWKGALYALDHIKLVGHLLADQIPSSRSEDLTRQVEIFGFS